MFKGHKHKYVCRLIQQILKMKVALVSERKKESFANCLRINMLFTCMSYMSILRPWMAVWHFCNSCNSVLHAVLHIQFNIRISHTSPTHDHLYIYRRRVMMVEQRRAPSCYVGLHLYYVGLHSFSANQMLLKVLGPIKRY